MIHRPVYLPTPGACLTGEEVNLVNLINEYRNEHGLPDAPVSKSLTTVAQWHVLDLHTNRPDSGTDPATGLECNLHSWSDWRPDLWTPVCYVHTHAYAEGMLFKPRQMTNNLYTGYGYENAYGSGFGATAQSALNAWRNSPPHNAVILEQDVWQGRNWPAMSVGIYEHYAVLWFGSVTDPQGPVTVCNVLGNPIPVDGALDQATNITLSWEGYNLDGNTLLYDLYLEADTNPPTQLVASNLSENSYAMTNLLEGTTYYWRIVVRDTHNTQTEGAVWSFTTEETLHVCLTDEEVILANLINDYRNQNGLPDVPLSKSLTAVAQWHVLDLQTNHPDSGTDPATGEECNLHSWSDWQPDLWTPVCYVDSNAYGEGMWFKPREITDNAYTGYGFENAYRHHDGATAQAALDSWRNSPNDNDIILEQGAWQGFS